MNTGRAASAAAAGLIASFFALVSGAIWVLTDFRTEFGFFATPKPLNTGELLLAYLVAPVLLAAGGVPPARVLGAGWPLSLLASAGASLAASLLVIASGFEPWAVSFGLAVAAGLVALSASVGIGGDPVAIPVLVVAAGALAMVGVAMLSAEDFFFFLIAVLLAQASWIVLPAVAGLFQHQSGGEGGFF